MASVSAGNPISFPNIIGRAEGDRKARKGEHMGVADKETKAYMRENEIFADAFNFFLYDGAQKIQPGLLRELDTTELAQLPGTDEKQLSEVIQKYRDVLKSAVIMQDEKASYLLLGIENQTDVHYAMPVRNMLYDVM